jgi:CBS domain-containing protein
MNASDIMVSKVITVKSSGTVQEVAELLLNNRISAVPVVDDSGELDGMASSGTPTRAPGMTPRGG